MNKKLITLIFTITVLTLPDLLAQSTANDNASQKIYFDNFEALTENRFVISQLSGEILAQIYNAKDKKIEKELIRSGRGPFELEYMGGMAFNKETNRMYAADLQNGKVISFDDQGNPLVEKQHIIVYPKFLDAYRNELIITSTARIGEGMPNRNKYPISYILDPNTLEITDTLFFDFDDLKPEQIEDFHKTPTFNIQPLVIASSKQGLYLVVFEGFNRIFLINKNSELIDKTSVMIDNIETPKVVKHPTFGYGQRIYSMMNDFIREREATYFSFGHTSRNIENGLIEVIINGGNKLSVQKYLLKTEWEETNYMNPLKVTIEDKIIYGADGIDIIPLVFDW